MNKFRFTIHALAVVVFTIAFASLAQAQATRTWVSGVGDDVNPCSRTAPCKTFAGAISKTANGGEIDCLDSGGFGAVTITKSLTIDGQGVLAGILAASTNGVIINAPTTDTIMLRNLSINGGPPTLPGLVGVKILAAKHVSIENCVIFDFLSTAPGNGRGISDTRTSGSLTVTDTTLENNAKNGAAILGLVSAVFDNVRFTKNGDATTASLAADSGAKVTVRNSVASHNPGIGFFGGSAGTVLDCENCTSVYNGTGIQASTTAVVRISNCYVAQNATGLSFAGATMSTFGNNKITGNGAGNTVPGGSLINPQ